jgi:hypothetical protein
MKLRARLDHLIRRLVTALAPLAALFGRLA